MGEPFLGEIRMLSFAQAPVGWAQCNGQFLPINQNQALFSLLGTRFGGNGQTTFALPDLRSRVPIHFDSFTMGTVVGEETHTLTVGELPAHNHSVTASSTNADQPTPPSMLAAANNAYTAAGNLTTLLPATVSSVGAQAHENRQPYNVLNFCIALIGIFPSRN